MTLRINLCVDHSHLRHVFDINFLHSSIYKYIVSAFVKYSWQTVWQQTENGILLYINFYKFSRVINGLVSQGEGAG